MEVDYLDNHRQLIPIVASWHHLQGARFQSRDSVNERIEKLTFCCGRRQIPTAVVAVKNRALLGSAMLVMHNMQGRMPLSPWLVGVFVLPDYRRQGIGTALVQRVVDEARMLGVAKLHLYSHREEWFYARLGWEIVERTHYRCLPVTVMSCNTWRQ